MALCTTLKTTQSAASAERGESRPSWRTSRSPAARRFPGGDRRHGPLFRGLDVDTAGTIYVAATGCGSVLKVTSAGQVTILPQSRIPWAPTGVARFGNDLYVLEFQNAESDDRCEMLPRVRKIAPDGTTAIIATVTRH